MLFSENDLIFDSDIYMCLYTHLYTVQNSNKLSVSGTFSVFIRARKTSQGNSLSLKLQTHH